MLATASSTWNPIATHATGNGASTGTRTTWYRRSRSTIIALACCSDSAAAISLGCVNALPTAPPTRIGNDLAIEPDQHCKVGIDPLAVIAEHGNDRVAVAGGDGFPERVVGRQQPRALDQALLFLAQRTQEHLLSRDELIADRRACGGGADRVDQHEAADLHHGHQAPGTAPGCASAG